MAWIWDTWDFVLQPEPPVAALKCPCIAIDTVSTNCNISLFNFSTFHAKCEVCPKFIGTNVPCPLWQGAAAISVWSCSADSDWMIPDCKEGWKIMKNAFRKRNAELIHIDMDIAGSWCDPLSSGAEGLFILQLLQQSLVKTATVWGSEVFQCKLTKKCYQEKQDTPTALTHKSNMARISIATNSFASVSRASMAPPEGLAHQLRRWPCDGTWWNGHDSVAKFCRKSMKTSKELEESKWKTVFDQALPSTFFLGLCSLKRGWICSLFKILPLWHSSCCQGAAKAINPHEHILWKSIPISLFHLPFLDLPANRLAKNTAKWLHNAAMSLLTPKSIHISRSQVVGDTIHVPKE